MFMGEYNHTIDTKGRLIIPSRFREELKNEFIVTKGLDGCLFVFPGNEWQIFEEKLKAGQIELIVQDSKEPLYIQADPRHLWRIFDNLMNNICKYAQASTRAYVNIENDGKNGKIIFWR